MLATFSQYDISFGGIVLHLESELPLKLGERLAFFEAPAYQANVQVRVRIMAQMPELPDVRLGEDMLLDYYRVGDGCWSVTKPGTLGPLTVTEYTPDASRMVMYVNEHEHPNTVRTVDKVLQLLPLRAMLTQRRRLVLHASRVEYGGRAILFTAPSGTGKSTQARLWHDVAGSRILSNDRTLLREAEGQWQSEAYAIDGSEAVEGNVTAPLGSIVVLRQSAENRVERLSALKAMKALMEQSMLDIWDLEQLHQAELLWLEILGTTPVYCLHCRPDAEAVHCLKERLMKDGVL